MNRSITNRWVIGIFVALLPLLPVCGFMLDGSPQVVFGIGGAAFVVGVLLVVCVSAASFTPPAGMPLESRRFQFRLRDLLCLTTVLFGMTMFILSGFQCEAAERLSRPDSLPAVAFRHFIWELEAGLVCSTIGGLVWMRSALSAATQRRTDSGL